MDLAETIARHDRVVLQFSGGKDSLACLRLMQPWLDKTVVLWCNPGNPYPETVEQMARVRKSVPHFLEVRGNQPQWVAENGHPVDVVPVWHTPFGQPARRVESIKFQSVFECCWANMWKPMHESVLGLGATLVVRGQKARDDLKAPISSGQTIDGVEYLFPLDDWTDDEVFAFLDGERIELPQNYRQGSNTSWDCWDCTAYAAHNVQRVRLMRERRPEMWAVVAPILSAYKTALVEEVGPYFLEDSL